MYKISKSIWIVGVTLVSILFWLIWLVKPDFPLDDAYIVQHSVKSLLTGYDDRFIGISPTQGITSPAHILLIYLLGIVMPVTWAQLVITVLASMLYILGVFRLAIMYGVSFFWSGVLAILSVLAGLSLYHMLNGLETGLAMAVIIWTFIWFENPCPKKKWQYGLLGVLPFVRPELGALSLLFFIRYLWDIRKADDGNFHLLQNIGWAISGSAPFIIFMLSNHGTLLPNTVAAKVYFFAEGCWDLAQKLHFSRLALEQFIINLGLSAFGFIALLLVRTRWIGMFFIVIFLCAYILRLPGALFHNWYRYLYLLTPFAMVGWANFISFPKTFVRRAGQVLLLLSVAVAMINIKDTWSKYREDINISRVELAGVSDWIISNLPEDQVILIHDAGYISLNGKQPLIDLVGLKTPSSIETHKKYTWMVCERDPRAIDEIAHYNNARYFVVFTEWDRIFRLTDSLHVTGWFINRVDTERGEAKYKVYKIFPPVNKIGNPPALPGRQ